MQRGYIKLWRKTKDTGLSCVLMGLWAHCLLEAAHTPHTVYVSSQRVELQPGQFVFGRGAWARVLGLTEKVLRNSVASLTERAMIRAITRASKFTIFEIVNWGAYQQSETSEGPAKGPAKGPALGQPKGQHRASTGPHSKNEENEDKKDNTPLTPLAGGNAPAVDSGSHPGKPARARRAAPREFPPELEAIWAACNPAMRACGRIDALNSWTKLKKSGVLPDIPVILRALDKYHESKEGQADPKWAHLSTWLNKGRWDTGQDIEDREGQTKAQREAEREAADRRQAEEDQRRKDADKAWERAWEKLPEDVKLKWREHAAEKNTFLSQAMERGQMSMVDIAARGAWRKHQEDKIHANRNGKAAA